MISGVQFLPQLPRLQILPQHLEDGVAIGAHLRCIASGHDRLVDQTCEQSHDIASLDRATGAHLLSGVECEPAREQGFRLYPMVGQALVDQLTAQQGGRPRTPAQPCELSAA
jgi:hypothetical protein